MSSRVVGAGLALIAAVLLAVQLATPALLPTQLTLFAGHPTVEGHTRHAQDVYVGLYSAELCRSDSDVPCKTGQARTPFRITAYGELATTGVLALGAVVLALLTLRKSERRKDAARVVRIAAAAALVLLALMVLIAPFTEATTPIGASLDPLLIGMPLYVVGVVGAMLASVIAVRPPPPIKLRVAERAPPPTAGHEAQGMYANDPARGEAQRSRRDSHGPVPEPADPFAASGPLRPLYEATPMQGGTGGLLPMTPSRAATGLPTPYGAEPFGAEPSRPLPYGQEPARPPQFGQEPARPPQLGQEPSRPPQLGQEPSRALPFSSYVPEPPREPARPPEPPRASASPPPPPPPRSKPASMAPPPPPAPRTQLSFVPPMPDGITDGGGPSTEPHSVPTMEPFAPPPGPRVRAEMPVAPPPSPAAPWSEDASTFAPPFDPSGDRPGEPAPDGSFDISMEPSEIAPPPVLDAPPPLSDHHAQLPTTIQAAVQPPAMVQPAAPLGPPLTLVAAVPPAGPVPATVAPLPRSPRESQAPRPQRESQAPRPVLRAAVPMPARPSQSSTRIPISGTRPPPARPTISSPAVPPPAIPPIPGLPPAIPAIPGLPPMAAMPAMPAMAAAKRPETDVEDGGATVARVPIEITDNNSQTNVSFGIPSAEELEAAIAEARSARAADEPTISVPDTSPTGEPMAPPVTNGAATPAAHSRPMPRLPISTAPDSLPPPKDGKLASGPTPACPQCESPMAWVEEHLRFYCKSCRMYF